MMETNRTSKTNDFQPTFNLVGWKNETKKTNKQTTMTTTTRQNQTKRNQQTNKQQQQPPFFVAPHWVYDEKPPNRQNKRFSPRL